LDSCNMERSSCSFCIGMSGSFQMLSFRVASNVFNKQARRASKG